MTPMKLHYFRQDAADESDFLLKGAIAQGYVPQGCLLGGVAVMDEMKKGHDPCAGCNGPRAKCGGRLDADSRKALARLFENMIRAAGPDAAKEQL